MIIRGIDLLIETKLFNSFFFFFNEIRLEFVTDPLSLLSQQSFSESLHFQIIPLFDAPHFLQPLIAY